jgi:hypothetical protein
MFASPDTQGIDTPQWLQVIHAVNEARPGTFGQPDGLGTLSAKGTKEVNLDGRFIEDYPEALVVMPGQARRFTEGATVLVIGKTPEVDAAIDAAAARLFG